ncbi:DUF4268 domain-containing protein [Halopseudomonas pertucinogena]|uniref:DUF4268 domain-containing protein n=1 Tax=Halopseudomonas pertucinogena TaxID=86175 RepID=A0ABQ2CTI8_9GAMM|nr:DUF4268 domain-containing protein [Halopseudomonas pertucinogena]GGJ07969.1 hypothetical protein GCM10009083_26140 [Halopseudomonas pertucinogena]
MSLIFSKGEVRVEFYMSRPQAETNQLVFDQLFAQKEQIEAEFGAELEWQPLPNRKACRIQYSRAVDGYNKDNWADMIKWLVEHMTRLESTLSTPLGVIRQNLKNQ